MNLPAPHSPIRARMLIDGQWREAAEYRPVIDPYRNLCAQIAADGYRGFTTTTELA